LKPGPLPLGPGIETRHTRLQPKATGVTASGSAEAGAVVAQTAISIKPEKAAPTGEAPLTLLGKNILTKNGLVLLK
jgi:hypothetical protein